MSGADIGAAAAPGGLRARVDAALARAVGQLPADTALAEPRRVLQENRDQFALPISVALVGRVSAGKSTLANALLGGRIAPTGVSELTFNVNTFHYAPEPRLTVHYKDPDRAVEVLAGAGQEALAALTARRSGADADAGGLDAIDFLEFAYPNRRLLDFSLIDTPGLDSVFGTDSANTLRFLGQPTDDSPDGMREHSRKHAARADALVYVVSGRGQAERDLALLRDFQGGTAEPVNPITVLGALTKIEQFWHRDREDALAYARMMAQNHMRRAGAQRLLHDLLPVAGLVAETAATLTAEEYDDLAALGRAVAHERLTYLLEDGESFGRDEFPELPVPAVRRHRLFDRLNAFGISHACRLIRDRCVSDPAGLRAQLEVESGLVDFRKLLLDHFGRRSDLIKLRGLINRVQALADAHDGRDPRASDWARAAVRRATAEVTQLAFSEHAFQELMLVHDYYAGALSFSESDAAEALRLVGARGGSAALRLGLPPDTPVERLAAYAYQRGNHWAVQVIDPGHSGATRRACRIVQRSLDALIAELGSE